MRRRVTPYPSPRIPPRGAFSPTGDHPLGAADSSSEHRLQHQGRVFVFYGALQAGTYSEVNASIAVTPSGAAGDGAWIPAPVGDLDGDGRDDFAVGVPGLDPVSADEGGAWLFLGSSLP